MNKKEELFIEANGAYERRDFQLAFGLFMKAALMGDDSSMSRLALMYFDGEGVEKNIQKSIEWDLNAIESGSVVSQSNLAVTYASMGEALKAEEYFNAAILIGDIDAALELAKLYSSQESKDLERIDLLKMVVDSDDACASSKEEAAELLNS